MPPLMKKLSNLPLLSLLALSCVSCSGISWQTRPLSAGNLEGLNNEVRQVVEVTPYGRGRDIFKAELTAWTCDRGSWRRALGPWPAVIGRNGFASPDGKMEGDGKTPVGIYSIGTAFGRKDRINTGLAYRQAQEDDLWVDDAASDQYNRWVKAPARASSYEMMLRQDGLYDVGAVIEYNTHPVEPGKGSAIFLHIWRENGNASTAGCVALEQRRLRRLLAWLKVDMSPLIVLGQP